jgi:hypothetical protein
VLALSISDSEVDLRLFSMDNFISLFLRMDISSKMF